MAGTGDCQDSAAIIEKSGVPKVDIEIECKSRSTKENALFSVLLLRATGARRVLIVTHWYHSRRALASFRKAAPEIDFRVVVTKDGLDQRFTRFQIVYAILKEYAKTLVYWIAYGISPW